MCGLVTLQDLVAKALKHAGLSYLMLDGRMPQRVSEVLAFTQT
jgi:hypothetical protein